MRSIDSSPSHSQTGKPQAGLLELGRVRRADTGAVQRGGTGNWTHDLPIIEHETRLMVLSQVDPELQAYGERNMGEE